MVSAFLSYLDKASIKTRKGIDGDFLLEDNGKLMAPKIFVSLIAF